MGTVLLEVGNGVKIRDSKVVILPDGVAPQDCECCAPPGCYCPVYCEGTANAYEVTGIEMEITGIPDAFDAIETTPPPNAFYVFYNQLFSGGSQLNGTYTLEKIANTCNYAYSTSFPAVAKRSNWWRIFDTYIGQFTVCPNFADDPLYESDVMDVTLNLYLFARYLPSVNGYDIYASFSAVSPLSSEPWGFGVLQHPNPTYNIFRCGVETMNNLLNYSCAGVDRLEPGVYGSVDVQYDLNAECPTICSGNIPSYDVPPTELSPIQVGIRTVIEGAPNTWTWNAVEENKTTSYSAGTNCLYRREKWTADIELNVDSWNGTYLGSYWAINSDPCPADPADIIDRYLTGDGCFVRPAIIPAKAVTGTLNTSYTFESYWIRNGVIEDYTYAVTERSIALTGFSRNPGDVEARGNDETGGVIVRLGVIGLGCGNSGGLAFRAWGPIEFFDGPVTIPDIGDIPPYYSPWSTLDAPAYSDTTGIPHITCKTRSYTQQFVCSYTGTSEMESYPASSGCIDPYTGMIPINSRSIVISTNHPTNCAVTTELYEV